MRFWLGSRFMRGRAEWIADEQPVDAFRYDTPLWRSFRFSP